MTPGGGGSGKGITDAANGVVDIGASDAYLSSSQVSQYPGMKNIALAISAQMVNYNIPFLKPAGPTWSCRAQVLSQIYQGKITEWNDPAITALNPNADHPVAPDRDPAPLGLQRRHVHLQLVPVRRRPERLGHQHRLRDEHQLPVHPERLGENGNGGMVSGCQATRGCIAYIGISYLSRRRRQPGSAKPNWSERRPVTTSCPRRRPYPPSPRSSRSKHSCRTRHCR